jgi:hypothetical protein
MSTAAQITANQQNASRSTGPRTPEGKAASSANATSHALTGNFRLLPAEDPNEFEELLRGYANEFQPVTEHECFLLTQMVEARWKLDRIERLQAEAFDQMLAAGEPDHSSDARILAGLSQPTTVFDRLQRYAAQAERTYHRAHRELAQLQKQQAKTQAAALDARLDQIMYGPPPDYTQCDAYRNELRNEANPDLGIGTDQTFPREQRSPVALS